MKSDMQKTNAELIKELDSLREKNKRLAHQCRADKALVNSNAQHSAANQQLREKKQPSIASLSKRPGKSAERKRAEKEHEALQEQLGHAQRMESIGQLAGGVAHDFNNALGGIMGYAELLMMHLSDNPKLAGYADRIKESVKHASGLTAQLLAFARKGKLNIAPFDFHQVVRETGEMLRDTIDRRIQVGFELLAEEYAVTGDENQLANVVLNLGLNARDAMPEGGKIVLSTGTTELKRNSLIEHGFEVEHGDYLRLEVRDTGTGMDESVRRRVFEPFYTTKAPGKGIGLGLAGAYGTVKQHRGYITVVSEPGGGSCFSVYLPLQKNNMAEDEHESVLSKTLTRALHGKEQTCGANTDS